MIGALAVLALLAVGVWFCLSWEVSVKSQDGRVRTWSRTAWLERKDNDR